MGWCLDPGWCRHPGTRSVKVFPYPCIIPRAFGISWSRSLKDNDDSNVHPALKHSCPQKNEPRIPSLPTSTTNAALVPSQKVRAAASIDTDLLQVGHSSLDGGLPLGHDELWQRTTLLSLAVDDSDMTIKFEVKSRFSSRKRIRPRRVM